MASLKITAELRNVDGSPMGSGELTFADYDTGTGEMASDWFAHTLASLPYEHVAELTGLGRDERCPYQVALSIREE